MRNILDRRYLVAIWAIIFFMKLTIGLAHVISGRKIAAPYPLSLIPDTYEDTSPEMRRMLDEILLKVNNVFGLHMRRARREHIIGAVAYLTAALTSLLSLLLELRGVLWGKGAGGPA